MQVSKGLKKVFRKFRGMSLGLFLTFVSVVIGFLTILPKITDFNSIMLVISGVIIFFLIYAFVFEFRKSFRRLEAWIHIITEYFGYVRQQNKYFKRSHHFIEEKSDLANSLVRELLPCIIQRIDREHGQANKTIRIILDSGTTITPIFPCLIRYGISGKANDSHNFVFYTNNLAGIDEIHRTPPLKKNKLSETDFNLIGGQPLNQQRATTGDFTEGILKDLFDEQDKSKGKIISIGIITSNWFLCHRSLDKLHICDRGRGHMPFKKILVDHCDYIILVTPLGKLLPMNGIDTLNSVLKNEHKDSDSLYREFEIPLEKRNQSYLHTSFRKSYSPSPLIRVSDRLKDIKIEDNGKNYIFSEACPVFDPKVDKYQARRMDLPHDYIQTNFKKIYGYEIP